ncbi:MAG: hypothetical protein LBK74_05360 [Treponema sp.]|jgi:hypothetical protein|nr:hypothetical protein [Treponema sp.]
MGDTGQTRKPARGLTFEDVWEMFQETGQKIKAMGEETDRKMRETDQIVKETARQMKETDKRVGEITNRLGDMVEHMVIPNLTVKFRELGFTFTQAGNLKITDPEHDIFTEVDALLENDDKVMAVEIKTTLRIGDIDDHLDRMEKLRFRTNLRNDRRIYLGAVAGVVIDAGVQKYALRNGLYVLKPSGETFIVTEPAAEGCVPREW